MKKIIILFFLLVMTISGQQKGDIMYFAARYDVYGEHGVSNRFYVGMVTVIVQLSAPVYYKQVTVQLDKYNPRLNEFVYRASYDFQVEPKDTYIYFPDVPFSEAGFYRVFLLGSDGNVITSALVEIILGYDKFK